MLKEVANELIAFILSYRKEPFRREKLKLLVDRFCEREGHSFSVCLYGWKEYKILALVIVRRGLVY
ncbi:MAG: hypothetical protein N2327_05455 [Caldimicrobium sp.]|nr:hypothetical protein [Caldimicrobium sp.]MCX7873857.1 hypothetical protein [Caldimicrobium sp.]MDW8093946.1 hypothetical protein [Caldimicrobium sp.]